MQLSADISRQSLLKMKVTSCICKWLTVEKSTIAALEINIRTAKVEAIVVYVRAFLCIWEKVVTIYNRFRRLNAFVYKPISSVLI